MDIQRKMQVPGEFKVINYDVRDFTGNYACMDYGDPNAPRLAQLRDEFGLEAIVSDCESEFEGMLALKRWVRSRWNHGWSRSGDKVKDALDILHEAAKGEQFNCGYYSIVFSECATALGWPARRVGLTIMDCEFPRDFNVGNVGHSVVEIWSNEYEKWVIMDSDLNVYYQRDGLPLNALEIRDAWLSGCADQVEMVQDEPAFVQPSAETVAIHREISEGYEDYDLEVSRFTNQRFTRHRVIDYYARVNIAGWEWVDDRGLPTLVRHFGPSGKARWTSNLAAACHQPRTLYAFLRPLRGARGRGWLGAARCRI